MGKLINRRPMYALFLFLSLFLSFSLLLSSFFSKKIFGREVAIRHSVIYIIRRVSL